MGDRTIWLGPWRLLASGGFDPDPRTGLISRWPGDYWARDYLAGGRRATRWLRLYPLPGERPLQAKGRK